MDAILKGMFYVLIGILVMFGVYLFSIFGHFIVSVIVLLLIGWIVSETLGLDRFFKNKYKK